MGSSATSQILSVVIHQSHEFISHNRPGTTSYVTTPPLLLTVLLTICKIRTSARWRVLSLLPAIEGVVKGLQAVLGTICCGAGQQQASAEAPGVRLDCEGRLETEDKCVLETGGEAVVSYTFRQ